MSTLKVGGIRGVSASSDAITVANDGTCTANVTNNLSNRRVNRNGSFIISQKNEDTEVTLGSSGGRWIDMIQTFLHNSATFKAQRVSDAPTGFQYSAKHTVSSADGSIAGTDEAMFIHRLEGFDTAKFAYGTSSAKQITVSFYVKSSLTGDFSFAAQTGSRNYVNEYTINSADTWERKSFTLPVLTDGTHNTTTGAGLNLVWDLGSGDNYATSTLGSWITAANLYRSTGSVRLSTNVNATWQITGIQVEEGTVMTDFEHFPIGDELALCQRYFYQITKIGSTSDVTNKPIGVGMYYTASDYRCLIDFPVEMRVQPTFSSNDNSNSFYIHYNANADFIDRLDGFNFTKKRGLIRNTAHVSGTQGYVGFLNQETGDSNLSFSAEL